MAKSVEELIKEANVRLKVGQNRLTIQLIKDKLFFQGILPPKPNSDRTDNHQQRIPTGYLGNPAGIQRAEADARIIAGQLIKKEFKWTDHVKIFTAENSSTSETLEKFKENYLSKASETSWNSYYSTAYKWLPQDKPISAKEIIKVLLKHPQDSSSRQKAFNAISALVKFCKLEIDLEPYKSTYNATSLNPKKIPSARATAHVS